MMARTIGPDMTDVERDRKRHDIRSRAALEAEAQIERARRVGAGTGIVDGRDLGPVIRTDVEPADWRDPADTSTGKRQPRTVRGSRRTDILVTLRRRGSPIELWHIEAANRYRRDYEIGLLGGRPGRDPDLPPTGRSDEPADPEARRLDILTRYNRATRAVGVRLSAVLVHVVLVGQDVTSFATLRSVDRQQAMGYLIAALDCLAEFYDVSKAITELQVDPIAPAR